MARQINRNGLIGTIAFHAILLLFLLLQAFVTPLPLPEEMGIMVEFGTTNTGLGNQQPRFTEQPANVPNRPTTTAPTPQEHLTQDIDESISLPNSRPTVQPQQQTPTQQTPPRPTTPTPPAPEPERTANPNAMFPGRGDASSTATSQGQAGGQGNQGTATGTPNVHVYGEGGDAGGNRWSLSGRGLVGGLPLPAYTVQEAGIVVVTITVDRNGNVTRAVAGAQGTTILNRTLHEAAERAARQARFTANPNVIEQQGTLTYIFRLQ